MTSYVFITGGVVSSLGKGITSACLGAILEARGLTISMIKLDPYINVDPGTMSPFQHGEVFVTHDGTETDLDLGHYERFVRTAKGGRHSNYTTGRIYESVIASASRRAPATPISASWRSAVLLVTLSHCRSSRLFARWASNWAAIVLCTFT